MQSIKSLLFVAVGVVMLFVCQSCGNKSIPEELPESGVAATLHNELPYKISIERYYDGYSPNPLKFSIEANGKYVIKDPNHMLTLSDSVHVVFDGEKEIWYFLDTTKVPYDLTRSENYDSTEIDGKIVDLKYYFSLTQYDKAIEIIHPIDSSSM